ncbi:hypothetical protein H8B09_25765 [Paenibacillus sp. PR3]|uniref:Uncharacterized protein n=1 Tax=Paenibacillus terricola TaxID=2763503 RepID=A0ABR8N6U1_9BACL|nr:hypothetical protein [Paenibacillus terricola]MBD3922189.1 hypothetical protein [Paenibacillus terricola]
MLNRLKRWSFIVNLVIAIICFVIVPNYVFHSHHFLTYVAMFIVAVIISDLILNKGKLWRPTRRK